MPVATGSPAGLSASPVSATWKVFVTGLRAALAAEKVRTEPAATATSSTMIVRIYPPCLT